MSSELEELLVPLLTELLEEPAPPPGIELLAEEPLPGTLLAWELLPGSELPADPLEPVLPVLPVLDVLLPKDPSECVGVMISLTVMTPFRSMSIWR